MSYAVEHANALADVRAAGAAVTFTVTGFGGVADSVVSGYATDATAGKRTRFVDGVLIQSSGPRLFFVAGTLGDVPALNAAANWGSGYRVATVEPYAPDGVALFSYVELAR